MKLLMERVRCAQPMHIKSFPSALIISFNAAAKLVVEQKQAQHVALHLRGAQQPPLPPSPQQPSNPCWHLQAPVIVAIAAMFFMHPTHPFLLFLTSIFARACAWGHDAHMHVAAEASALMAQPLHRCIPPALVAVLVACSLWQAMRATATAMSVSRTVTISDVDELMMQHGCGCDCGQVTAISNVTVAPSPELSFEPLQPQLKLDTCDAVGACCCVYIRLEIRTAVLFV